MLEQVPNSESSAEAPLPVQDGGEAETHASNGNGSRDSGSACRSCGAGLNDTSAVYAVGTVEARFPRLDVEKEAAQAIRGGKTANLTDQQVLHAILSRPENRHITREMCWVLTIEGLDTYVLLPETDREMDMFTEALQPTRDGDRDAIIGTRTRLAPPDLCNGLQIPMVVCHQMYSFDVEQFISAIPKPKAMKEDLFRQTSRELFDRIMQLADNVGATPEHRAMNYLALRYPAIYALTVERHAADSSLVGVDVRPSRLSGVRQIVDVIFTYMSRTTDVTDKYFTRVDVTGRWPFLVSKLQPFYDR